jgi:hypothetical protein
MTNAPLCALVHDETNFDPGRLAACARACMRDVRAVLARHGFERSANGLTLATMALQDDLDAIAAREWEPPAAAE